MIDFLTHPYVIIFIVVSVVISNIMLLKYTANLGVKKKEDLSKSKKDSNKSIEPKD